MDIVARLLVVLRLTGVITHGSLLAMFLLCAWSFSASGFVNDNNEVEALMSIKGLLKDPHNALRNWDEDAVDACSWDMVTCSSENLVVSLESPNQNFSGSLSPSIGNLTNLGTLIVGNPLICGTDPQKDCPGIQSVTTANFTHAQSNVDQYRNSISFLHVFVFILIICAFF